MAYYEYPNSTDTQGLFQYFGYINRAADGLFFPVILLVVWFISFISIFSSSGGNRPAAARGFAFSSFLTSILSIMLAIMGFLAPKFMYLNFILTAVGILWVKLESS